MKLENKNIQILIKRRNEIWKTYEDSFDDKICDYTMEEPKEIDELSKEIIHLLFKNESKLDTDCIIQSLTSLGYSPNILYDDNGHFAVISDGIQTVSMDDEAVDMDMSFFIEKENWKDTIREALHIYLEDIDPELWTHSKREQKLKRITKQLSKDE